MARQDIELAFKTGGKVAAENLLPCVLQPSDIRTTFDFGNYKDMSRVSLLHIAAFKGWMSTVSKLVARYGSDINHEDSCGHVPLHYAAYNGHLEVVKFFGKSQKAVIDKRSKFFSLTPLFFACENGHLNVAKYLIEELNCDPLHRDIGGWTLVHYACQGGHLIVVQFIIKVFKEKAQYPFCKNCKGNTPLHIACINGKLNIAKHLINEELCNPSCQNKDGRTPLHWAFMHNHVDIVRYLLSTGQVNPLVEVTYGGNALSIARGDDMIKLFQPFETALFPVDTFTKLILIGDSGAGKTTIAELIVRLASSTAVDCVTDVQLLTAGIVPHLIQSEQLGNFVVYDFSGCLEYCSSHAAVLEQVMRGSAAIFLCVVDLRKSKENICESLRFWLSFIDNAAECRSLVAVVGSHADQDTSSEEEGSTSNADQMKVEVVQAEDSYTDQVEELEENRRPNQPEEEDSLVDRTVEEDNHVDQPEEEDNHVDQPEEEDNHVHQPEEEDNHVHQPEEEDNHVDQPEEEDNHIDQPEEEDNHVDQPEEEDNHVDQPEEEDNHVDQAEVEDSLVDQTEEEEKSSLIQKVASEMVVHQQFTGYFKLDCRKPNTYDSDRLFDKITTSHVPNQPVIHYYSNVVYAFLTKLDMVCCTLHDLVSEIERENVYYLPKNESVLIEVLTSLSNIGLIFFVRHNQSSWIVVKTEILLNKINGTLFAPDHFNEHRHDLASNIGIVPVSSLREIFPDYDSEMIIGFLTSLDFCLPVDQTVLQYTTNLQTTPSRSIADLLFFPGLIQSERPDNLVQQGVLQFGWCLRCIDPHEFFSSRFLHVLLLSVAASTYKFPLASQAASSSVSDLQRTCKIWRNGIFWSSLDNITMVIELIDKNRCVLVAMSCDDTSPAEHAELRSSLVDLVRKHQQQYCPHLNVSEFLISPNFIQQYPLDNLPDSNQFEDLFPIRHIARYMLLQRTDVSSYKDRRGSLTIETLLSLLFEPYHQLRSSSVIQLLNPNTAEDPVPSLLLQEVRQIYRQTKVKPQANFRDLREYVDTLSLFTGRNNPLVSSVQYMIVVLFYFDVYRRWLG